MVLSKALRLASMNSSSLNKLIYALAMVVWVFPTSLTAYEVKDICATYLGKDEAYEVEAKIMEGSELNNRTSSYDYRSFEKYVIIFWGSGEASIIQLESSFCDISYRDCEGLDQQGYIWEIKENNYGYCR